MQNSKRKRTTYLIIWILLLVVSLLITFLFFLSNFYRLFITIKSTGLNIAYYVVSIIIPDPDIKAGVPLEEVFNYRGGFNGILPIDFESFKNEIVVFFELIINFTNIGNYFVSSSKKLSNLLRLALIVIMFLPLMKLMMNAYLSKKEEKKIDETSKQLKWYLKFKETACKPVKEYVQGFVCYSKEHFKRLVLPLIIIVMFWINVPSAVLDTIGWYLYFISSLDFMSIYEIFCLILIDFSPFLLKVPLVIYLVVGYIIFDRMRINKAYERLEHFENYNKGFVSSLGVYTLVNGAPGVGKTLLLTDLQLSADNILRDKLFAIMHEIDLMLPHFPFINLEKEMDKKIKSHQIYNHFLAREFIEKKKEKFIKNKTIKNLFNYDYKKENVYINNSLFIEDLFEALSDYAQAYYIYQIKSSLIASNYAIRAEGVLHDEGFMKRWTYEFFQVDPFSVDESFTSKIIDFNSMRLHKKVKEKETVQTNDFTLDCKVVGITEVGKERKNQLFTKELKRKDTDTNQLNDGFNDYAKVKRHDSTIRNKCLYYGFLDDQRSESLNADMRELCEYTIVIHQDQEEFHSSLLMFWLEPIICNLIINLRDSIFYRFRMVRGDKTLFIYLLNSIAFKFNSYLVKRTNTFNYKKLVLEVSNKLDVKEQNYYLCSKKIFARRYSTNCYESYFEGKYKEEAIGFEDLLNYSNYKASIEELNLQNSYFVNELNGSFASVDNTIEDTIYN